MKYNDGREPRAGDIVEIVFTRFVMWRGMRASVIKVNGAQVLLKPLIERPDNFGYEEFHWPPDSLIKVD